MCVDKVMPHSVTDQHKSPGRNFVRPQNTNTSHEGDCGPRYKDRRKQRTDESNVTDWGPQNVSQVIRQEACQMGETNFFRETFVRLSFLST